MKVYDSFGTFDKILSEFNLAGQATNIGTDNYEVTAYYDISNVNRFALLAILQTVDGNETDLREYPTNCAFLVNKISFGNVNTSYLTAPDKRIESATTGDIINVVVHHGIGFDPVANEFDNDYIENYKAETYTYYSKGAQPGKGGKGMMSS